MCKEEWSTKYGMINKFYVVAEKNDGKIEIYGPLDLSILIRGIFFAFSLRCSRSYIQTNSRENSWGR